MNIMCLFLLFFTLVFLTLRFKKSNVGSLEDGRFEWDVRIAEVSFFSAVAKQSMSIQLQFLEAIATLRH